VVEGRKLKKCPRIAQKDNKNPTALSAISMPVFAVVYACKNKKY